MAEPSKSQGSSSSGGSGTMTVKERVDKISRDLQSFNPTQLDRIENFIRQEQNNKP